MDEMDVLKKCAEIVALKTGLQREWNFLHFFFFFRYQAQALYLKLHALRGVC